jgi:hypothetical protein
LRQEKDSVYLRNTSEFFDRTYQHSSMYSVSFLDPEGFRNTVHTEKTTLCPGCGLVLPGLHLNPPDRFNASGECWQLFSDLSCYSVAKQDTEFIHQYVVDAYGAQHAGGTTRNITVVFGLIGLYLALEQGFTGRQVQLAHMRLAKIRKDWPRLDPPLQQAAITILDVLMVPDDTGKDAMIRQWMAAVWENWADQQECVREMTRELLHDRRARTPEDHETRCRMTERRR